MIHGKDLLLAINGTALAASKSCNVSKGQSFLEVSAPTGGRWESFVPQKLGWSITSDCLLSTMAAYKTLDAAWKAGTALTIRFYDTEFDENETGTAYIERLDLVASKGNLAHMSVSLKGSGALSTYGGASISLQLTNMLSMKYYTNGGSGTTYSAASGQNAVVKGAPLTLSKRTLIEITPGIHLIFLTRNQSIATKVTNSRDIVQADYEFVIDSKQRVWLDAGTWYIVDSTQNNIFQPATYYALSI